MRGNFKRLPAFAGLVLALCLITPTAWAVVAGQTLDVTQGPLDSPTGVEYEVTGTLGSPEPADTNILFEITGPNDLDGSDSVDTPDLSCPVPAGELSCSVSLTGTATGRDEFRGWIEGTEPDVTEDVNAQFNPGAVPETDTTDVVAVNWFDALPATASLTCVPKASLYPATGAGSGVVSTCSLTGEGGPFAGERIDVENLEGANDPDDSSLSGGPDYNDACVTNANGVCDVTTPASESQSGTASLCYWVDQNEDGSFGTSRQEWDGGKCDSEAADTTGELTDRASARWAPRARLGLKLSDAKVKSGTKVKFTVTLQNCGGQAGSDVRLLEVKAGTSTVLARKALDASCKAVFTRKLTKDGDFKGEWPQQGTARYTGTSAVKHVDVTK